jgi:hypothetical protein
MLRAFSHNHIGAVGVWLGLFGFGGGLAVVFTTPRWQTPWYRGVRSPSAWKGLEPGMTREDLIARLGTPIVQTAEGEEIWRERGWELRVRYDATGHAVEISSQTQ